VSTAEKLSLLEIARQGNNDACQRLLEENTGLIWSIVRRYSGRAWMPKIFTSSAAWGF
jgi:RNA polymerase sporulation-specific sigma factor